MSESLRVKSPGDLVAAVPHVLGFEPQESLVVLLTGPGSPLMRVDLPPEPAQAELLVQSMLSALKQFRKPDQLMFLLAYSDDIAQAGEVLNRVADGLREASLTVSGTLLVRGQEWLDPTTGRLGVVAEETRSLFAAQGVFAGRPAPLPSRESIAEAFRGDTDRVAALLPDAMSRFSALDRKGRVEEAAWVGTTLDTFVHERRYPNDADAARLLAALQESSIFANVALNSSREDARELADLWTNITSRSPATVRGPAAEIAALTSYLEGNGAKAYIALDLVDDPSDISSHLNSMLEKGVSPQQWDIAKRVMMTDRQRAAVNWRSPASHRPPPPPPRGMPGIDR